jgi:hypothetical protein
MGQQLIHIDSYVFTIACCAIIRARRQQPVIAICRISETDGVDVDRVPIACRHAAHVIGVRADHRVLGPNISGRANRSRTIQAVVSVRRTAAPVCQVVAPHKVCDLINSRKGRSVTKTRHLTALQDGVVSELHNITESSGEYFRVDSVDRANISVHQVVVENDVGRFSRQSFVVEE